MVEVFKTNVENREVAERLVKAIHHAFLGYEANFDLDDCDRILRVQFHNGIINTQKMLAWLKERGCYAEVLPDEFDFPRHAELLQKSF